MHPVLGFLACGWLGTWLVVRITRRTVPQELQAFPKPSGGFLMIGALIIIVPLTTVHYAKIASLSHRYLLLPAALLSSLAAGGALILARGCAVLARRLGWARSRLSWFLPIVLAPILAGLLLHTFRPRRQDKAHHLAAARFLRQEAGKDDWLVTDSFYVLRYAEIPGEYLAPSYLTAPVWFLAMIQKQTVTLLAVQPDELRKNRPEIAGVLREPAFGLVRTFVNRAEPEKPDRIQVFRVDRAAAKALLKAEYRRFRRERAKTQPSS
jgi:hypothetical protein